MGTLAANSSIVSRQAWQEAGGYDESYAGGGEDGALGRTIIGQGKIIIQEPLSAVYHSHGLGPINSSKQFWHWYKISKPNTFNTEHIHARRPDLKRK